MLEKVNGQNNLQALYRFFSLTIYNLLWFRTRGNQFCSSLYILTNLLSPLLTVFEVCRSLWHSTVAMGFMKKEHVSLANTLSEQTVWTSRPSVAHLSLMLISFFKRLLSFPHAPDAIYFPKGSSRDMKIKPALQPKPLYFFTYQNRQNKTHVTTSIKNLQLKDKRQVQRVLSRIPLHWLEVNWQQAVSITFLSTRELEAFSPQTRPAPILVAP